MLTVKNEKITVLTAEESDSANSLKPLKSLGLMDSDTSGGAGAAAQEPAAAAGSARLGHPAPGYAPEDIAMAVGVIATALLLTYGNVIMEVLFRILGI